MGMQCQIISVRFKFSNVLKLKSYDTRKFSIHLLFCFSLEFIDKYMESQKRIARFLTQLHSLNLISKVFFPVL